MQTIIYFHPMLPASPVRVDCTGFSLNSCKCCAWSNQGAVQAVRASLPMCPLHNSSYHLGRMGWWVGSQAGTCVEQFLVQLQVSYVTSNNFGVLLLPVCKIALSFQRQCCEVKKPQWLLDILSYQDKNHTNTLSDTDAIYTPGIKEVSDIFLPLAQRL